jgi:hypothetical protein
VICFDVSLLSSDSNLHSFFFKKSYFAIFLSVTSLYFFSTLGKIFFSYYLNFLPVMFSLCLLLKKCFYLSSLFTLYRTSILSLVIFYKIFFNSISFLVFRFYRTAHCFIQIFIFTTVMISCFSQCFSPFLHLFLFLTKNFQVFFTLSLPRQIFVHLFRFSQSSFCFSL